LVARRHDRCCVPVCERTERAHDSEHDDVLVCKLMDGKITCVHRGLWPGAGAAFGALPRGATGQELEPIRAMRS
jgi:hypothetical protein